MGRILFVIQVPYSVPNRNVTHNMSNQKRNILYIALLIVGVVLCAAGSLGYIDSFWSGMGGAIIGVSAVRLVLSVKYKNDPKYAKI